MRRAGTGLKPPGARALQLWPQEQRAKPLTKAFVECPVKGAQVQLAQQLGGWEGSLGREHSASYSMRDGGWGSH